MSAVPKAYQHVMKKVLKKTKASPCNLPPPTTTPQPDESSTANSEDGVDVMYEETTEDASLIQYYCQGSLSGLKSANESGTVQGC